MDNLAATGAEEIICFHEDCYAMLVGKAPDYGIRVPFRPVHLYEYLLDYVKAHEKEITRLDLKVAHQPPCASRYSRDKDPLLDEIYDRIGVTPCGSSLRPEAFPVLWRPAPFERGQGTIDEVRHR